jgi:hypothetical protein
MGSGDDNAHVGVVAQEVQAIVPEAAVRRRDGYLRASYDRLGLPQQEIEMKKNRTRIFQLISGALLGLMAMVSLPTTSQAEIGSVRVVFAKAGLVAGVGVGRGLVTFRGHNYPFRVSGMSWGATIGASTNKMIGRALNMHSPGDIAGSYSTVGAGVALAGGVGGVQLQNAKGVILQLHGVKAGLELSASLGSVEITMER